MMITSAVLALTLFKAPEMHAKGTPKSISVDCAKGQSLNTALTDGATPLVIEFSGVCAEDVVITRGDVTLRGIAPGAKISGAPSPPAPAPAIGIRGVANVVLKDFTVQDGDRRGVDVRAATDVTLDGIVANGNASDGLMLAEASSAFVRNSSFNDNAGDGIGVWQNSSVLFEGTIAMNGNARAGLLLSGSSQAALTFFGGQVSANDNAACGYILQLGATAQLAAASPTTVTASGNGDCGASLFDSASWGGPLTVQNSPVGVDVNESTFESSVLSVSGCTIGLFAHLSSFVRLRAPAITSNQFGIRLDGATSQINNAALQGNSAMDLQLQFGTRASFNATSSAGTVSCDGTVLIRGPIACPANALHNAMKVQPPAEIAWTATLLEQRE